MKTLCCNNRYSWKTEKGIRVCSWWYMESFTFQRIHSVLFCFSHQGSWPRFLLIPHLEKCHLNDTGTMRHTQYLWGHFLFEVMRQGQRKQPCWMFLGIRAGLKQRDNSNTDEDPQPSQILPTLPNPWSIQIRRSFLSTSEAKDPEFCKLGELWFPEQNRTWMYSHIAF